jgi:ABC-2 type transport system ATP-binding protein
MHAGRIAALGTVAALKGTFGDRALVEVRTPAPMEALRALDGAAMIEKASLFGTALHVVLKPGAPDPRPLAAVLASRGIPVEALTPVEPSLEDVFMEVVERETAADARRRAS